MLSLTMVCGKAINNVQVVPKSLLVCGCGKLGPHLTLQSQVIQVLSSKEQMMWTHLTRYCHTL